MTLISSYFKYDNFDNSCRSPLNTDLKLNMHLAFHGGFAVSEYSNLKNGFLIGILFILNPMFISVKAFMGNFDLQSNVMWFGVTVWGDKLIYIYIYIYIHVYVCVFVCVVKINKRQVAISIECLHAMHRPHH